MGLSPRGRGNHLDQKPSRLPCGAIPARAGEPDRPRAGATSRWGYPRAGGGTGMVDLPGRDGPERGAIPARAGEPRIASHCHVAIALGGYPRAGGGTPSGTGAPFADRGYPRAGGGTIAPLRAIHRPRGLSPRGRGNQESMSMMVIRDGLSPRGRGNRGVGYGIRDR